MGATASTVRNYNEVMSCRRRDVTYIPIEGVQEHLRMFQHQKDGDILILVDTDGEEFLKDPASSQYHEIFISARGKTYLDNLSGAMTFQATKGMLDKAREQLASVNSPGANAITQSPEAAEKEPTLFQLHLLEHPNSFYERLSLVDQPPLSARSKDSKSSAEERTEVTKKSRTPEREIDAKSTVSSSDAKSESVVIGAARSRSTNRESEPLGALSFSASRSVDFEGDFHSNFSSLSRSVDSTPHAPSAAAANFLRHEQEALARVRAESLRSIAEESADSKSEVHVRRSPRRLSFESKSMVEHEPSVRTSPRLSRQASINGEEASVKSTTPESYSQVATAGGSPSVFSRADSKDISKEEARESKVAPEELAVRRPMRTIAPVAYLPPSEHHRKRILEQEAALQASAIPRMQSSPERRDDLAAIDRGTPPRSGGARSPGLFGLDAKIDADGQLPRFSPRTSSPSVPADGKPPSLRTAYNHVASGLSNASTSTSAMAGIADIASTSISICPTLDCCSICFQELRDSTREHPEKYELHLESCRMRQEMKNALQNIDQHLQPRLDELSEFNQTQLNLVYSSAIGRAADEFDQCAIAHTTVKKMVKSVLRITYDSSAKKLAKVEANLASVQSDIAASMADAENDHRKGIPDALRKCNAYAYLARVLKHTADKLSLKQQSIQRYHKYLLGIQDFCPLRKLGKGSFASVYLARTCDTKQLCAIKTLSKAEVRERGVFDQVMKERTALTMASRYPEYFVKLLYCFQNQDYLFFAMEYMQGGDCLALISTMKRLPEHVAQHFIAQVSLAVRHLHLHGVIHRDIKPDNIMITSRGHAKLGDFGSVHPIHTDYLVKKGASTVAAAAPVVANNTNGGSGSGSMAVQSIHSRSENFSQFGTPSSKEGPSPNNRPGVPILSMSNIANEMSQVYKNLASRISSRSNSNSLWLEEELQTIRVLSESTSGSANWSSSSTSSLCFKKPAGGPVMQNTFDIVGNYFYASPEMAAGACIFNQSVDWWAVGVLLYHMLSGTTPFEGLTKAATLDNIEHIMVDWDPLPPISADCKEFLVRIITQPWESRLGTANGDEVVQHPFFGNIDFSTLYDGYGPIYPRAPQADESSPDFYCFSVLTEAESLDVPQFEPGTKLGNKELHESPRTNSQRRGSGNVRRGDIRTGVAEDSEGSPPQENYSANDRPSEEDIFQEFDYHPF